MEAIDVTQHEGLIGMAFASFARDVPRGELDDLRQCCRLALVVAAKRFDPQRAAWSTFALTVLRGEIGSFRRRLRAERMRPVVALDTVAPADVVHHDDAIARVDARMTLQTIRQRVRLSASEDAIIARRYYAGDTLREAGATLGVTKQRAQRIEAAAMVKLRGAIAHSECEHRPPTLKGKMEKMLRTSR